MTMKMKKDILNSDKVVISGSLVDWEDDLKYNLECIKNALISE